MAKPVYRVEGGRRLRQTLAQADTDLQDLKAAHRKAADLAAQAARPSTPDRTGRLRNTIRAAGTKTAAIIRAGFRTVPYAGPIHWGWRRTPYINRTKGWRGGPIPAQPWLSKAAQDTESRWVPIYEQYVEQTIAKVKGA